MRRKEQETGKRAGFATDRHDRLTGRDAEITVGLEGFDVPSPVGRERSTPRALEGTSRVRTRDVSSSDG